MYGQQECHRHQQGKESSRWTLELCLEAQPESLALELGIIFQIELEICVVVSLSTTTVKDKPLQVGKRIHHLGSRKGSKEMCSVQIAGSEERGTSEAEAPLDHWTVCIDSPTVLRCHRCRQDHTYGPMGYINQPHARHHPCLPIPRGARLIETTCLGKDARRRRAEGDVQYLLARERDKDRVVHGLEASASGQLCLHIYIIGVAFVPPAEAFPWPWPAAPRRRSFCCPSCRLRTSRDPGA